MKAVRYHDGERACAALLKVGHKNLHAVVIDDVGVRVISEPLAALKHCTDLTLRGQPYPLARLVKHLRRAGHERGITQAALAILDETTEQLTTTEGTTP